MSQAFVNHASMVTLLHLLYHILWKKDTALDCILFPESVFKTKNTYVTYCGNAYNVPAPAVRPAYLNYR